MPFDDDDAIAVDEFLDELTELLVIPIDSPVRAVRPAIVLPERPPRPALLVLPEDIAEHDGLRPAAPVRAPSRRPGPRRQLTPFAPRVSQRWG